MALTAAQAVQQIQGRFGAAWKSSGTDGFKAGKPDTTISGIMTAWAPSIDVLHQAATSGHNLIVSVLPPFWAQPAGGRGGGRGAATPAAAVENTDLYTYANRYIAEHNLVVWRFSENWEALPNRFRLHALASELGWQGREDAEATKKVASINAAVYAVPQTSLRGLANNLKTKPGLNAIRIVGEPGATISRIVLRPGYLLVPDAMQLVRETRADAVVCGEACEWEAFVYYQDWITAGWGKALLMLGYAASEAPGARAMASWISSVIAEVPVSTGPSGERFGPVKG